MIETSIILTFSLVMMSCSTRYEKQIKSIIVNTCKTSLNMTISADLNHAIDSIHCNNLELISKKKIIILTHILAVLHPSIYVKRKI